MEGPELELEPRKKEKTLNSVKWSVGRVGEEKCFDCRRTSGDSKRLYRQVSVREARDDLTYQPHYKKKGWGLQRG